METVDAFLSSFSLLRSTLISFIGSASRAELPDNLQYISHYSMHCCIPAGLLGATKLSLLLVKQLKTIKIEIWDTGLKWVKCKCRVFKIGKMQGKKFLKKVNSTFYPSCTCILPPPELTLLMSSWLRVIYLKEPQKWPAKFNLNIDLEKN